MRSSAARAKAEADIRDLEYFIDALEVGGKKLGTLDALWINCTVICKEDDMHA